MSVTTGQLGRIVRRHVPGLEKAPVFEPIPTGKFNSSFLVRAGSNELVLRIAPRRDSVLLFYEREMMRQEPAIHATLRARTAVPVPRVLAFDDTRELIDRDYILLERLPGLPWTDAGHVDPARVLRQVGECLAEVHRIRGSQYGYIGAHRPMEPQGSWVDAFVVMWNKLIDDVCGVGFYDASESGRLRRLLDEHLPRFDRPIPASLLHMDVWHQNILVDAEGRLTGLLDWDRALWGDPEIEFAVLDYCGISEPAFWEGYGAPRDVSTEARVRQIFYLLYELQKYIVIRAGRNGDPGAAGRYKHQVWEIVARAFQP